jgi:type II secretory pathway component PulK
MIKGMGNRSFPFLCINTNRETHKLNRNITPTPLFLAIFASSVK